MENKFLEGVKHMEITEVKVTKVQRENSKTIGYASVVIDGCFRVNDIKILSGDNGLFIGMPSKKIGDIKDAQSGKIDLLFEENIKTERVNFARKMLGARTPSVLLTIGGGSSWTKSLHATATTSDNSGFDINYGSDSGSGTVSVSWFAVGRDK